MKGKNERIRDKEIDKKENYIKQGQVIANTFKTIVELSVGEL